MNTLFVIIISWNVREPVMFWSYIISKGLLYCHANVRPPLSVEGSGMIAVTHLALLGVEKDGNGIAGIYKGYAGVTA